jgi:hypothetical protein
MKLSAKIYKILRVSNAIICAKNVPELQPTIVLNVEKEW